MGAINAAIIGCGAIHTRHVEAIQKVPEAKLRAIVDIDSQKGEALAAKYSCQFYQDFREMLLDETINVVHICTPHFLHKSMILASIAAGKHVFCEKPVVMNASEAEEIRRAVENAPGKLAVCYQNRLNPSSRLMKQYIDSNKLGKMLSIKAVLTWCRPDKYYSTSPWRGRYATEGGGLLINQAIHTLDLMQWLGGGVERLKGVVESSLLVDIIETEDTAIATMQLRNGARGLFYGTNCYTRDSPLQMDIHCEEGTLQLCDNELWLLTSNSRVRLVSDQRPEGSTEAKCYWGTSHELAIQNFYMAMMNEPETEYVGIEEAEKSLNIVEAINSSSKFRKWINFPD